ncbi:acyl-CoA dehydrogenase family protein [Neobacillus niacini]|uniref:acyl-CoA dehydrogenase family protein n=1 Tax=Neobacillus niacini TaxID=86668 RepID=UPI002FFF1356
MQKVFPELNREEAMKRVDRLIPSIQSRANLTEEIRRQPIETIEEFIEAKLLRQLMPKRWGGYELDIEALYETTAKISKADPSAGWCYGLLVLHSWMLAYYPEEAQQEVWGENPDACIASSFGSLPGNEIKQVKGGYTVSGEWGFSSGINHSDWIMISTVVGPERSYDSPQYLMMLVPKSDFTIKDTWETIAQKGTGSNNIQLTEVFIPSYRTIDMAVWCQTGVGPGSTINNNLLYQHPLYAVMPVCLTSSILGASQGAYELWKNTMKKKSTVRGANVSDYTHQQIRLAEVCAMLEAAEALLEKSLMRLRTGEPIDTYERLRLRKNYGFTAKLCKTAMQTMIDHSGAGSMFEKNPLQRYWRDVQASSMHITFNMDYLGEMFGKVELGLPLSPKDTLLS